MPLTTDVPANSSAECPSRASFSTGMDPRGMNPSGWDEKAIPARSTRNGSSVSPAFGQPWVSRRAAAADDSPPGAGGESAGEDLAPARGGSDPPSNSASEDAGGGVSRIDMNIQRPRTRHHLCARPGPVSAPPTGLIAHEWAGLLRIFSAAKH